jgi:hypothetical protein
VRNTLAEPDFSEFCFPHLDTHIRVDVSEEFVTIRASRDTFSSSRKEYFIRNLVSEGFIPERYRWSRLAGPEASYSCIHWLVDYSWMRISEEVLAISRRFVLRLFAGTAVLSLFLLELGIAGFMGDSRISVGNERNSAAQNQGLSSHFEEIHQSHSITTLIRPRLPQFLETGFVRTNSGGASSVTRSGHSP